MDERDLEAIEERLEKATPGPWHAGKQDPVIGRIKISARTGVSRINYVGMTDPHEVGLGICEREHRANAAFIARAPTDIRALLNEVRRGKAIEDLARRMRDVLDDVEWMGPDNGYDGVCPSCLALAHTKYKHESDCELAAVLADAAKLLGEK